MPRVSFAALALGTLAMCGTAGAQHTTSSPQLQRSPAPPRVVPNDNRQPAGARRGDLHEVRLVAAFARWHPNGDRDSAVTVPALAAEGAAPSIPAPLVRVRAGTRLRFVVRNTLDDSLQFCVRGGLPCQAQETHWILPGEAKTLDVTASDTGLFAYYGALRRIVGGERVLIRSQMTGAFVVDGPSPRPDRIIVLNGWNGSSPGGNPFEERFFIAMNGLLWPHTERLQHSVGDTVRWRMLNATRDFHPMHLHGFYFRVMSTGDGRVHRPNGPGAQPLVVTENLPALGGATVEWVPDRAGNWLFHCHKALHVSPGRRSDLRGEKPAPPGPLLLAASSVGHDHADAKQVNHALDVMSGMVMGIEVRPRAGTAAAPAERARRAIRVLAQRRAGGFGRDAALGFTVQSGDAEPHADSLVTPARPILLERGEPVSITVVNRLGEHTGVHWHGIELESFFDGVPGWSGGRGGGDPKATVAPMIAPSDSFVARFTPPRAGTFMFHAHADEMRQLASGLVGALVVLEPGQKWNRETDHLIVISQAGPSDTASIVVNGRASHMEMALKAGVKHRFRVVSIAPQDDVGVLLIGPGGFLKWRAVAKDGADLPPALAVEETAFRRFGPGETFDFELTPERGYEGQLVVRSFTNVMITLVGR